MLARHHEDCVHAGNRLELDDVLAQPAVAGIHNFFQFDDNRLGTAILDGIDADGLTAHPIDVEAHHRVDGRAALGAAALYDEQIARRIGANGAGPGGKTVEQLEQRRRGDVLQRDDGDTKARLGEGLPPDLYCRRPLPRPAE